MKETQDEGHIDRQKAGMHSFFKHIDKTSDDLDHDPWDAKSCLEMLKGGIILG